MAEMKVVKKVMKLGGRGAAGGKNEDTGLRPYYVEKIPPCTFMCPSAEDIRGYITYIAQAEKYGRTASESFTEGWHIITNRNPFPATMGRVCPHPCEGACNRGKLGTVSAPDHQEELRHLEVPRVGQARRDGPRRRERRQDLHRARRLPAPRQHGLHPRLREPRGQVLRGLPALHEPQQRRVHDSASRRTSTP